jgi:phosphate acetyltransferase
VRPALQIIGTKEKFHKVSGIFFMILENRLLLFADCAINIDPNSTELAEIAIDTAETAKRFGIEPKIAMLSFSTNGSAKHPDADKVREAVQMIKYKRPELIVDGEMQVDAALVPEISQRKFPNSKIKGEANVLIFPDLQSGNIAYKLVERLAKAEAIGPILQGLNKPVNDLSRGCSFQDIADLAAITACEAQELTHEFGTTNS